MPDHPLDLARLRALMDAAGAGVELPMRVVACQQPAGSYRVVNGRNVVLCLGLSDLEAAYLAALLNAAPALLEMASAQDAAVLPYLKEGESVAERLARYHREVLGLLDSLARETQRTEAAIQRAEFAEAWAQRLEQALRDIRDAVELCQSIDAELAALATTTQEDKVDAVPLRIDPHHRARGPARHGSLRREVRRRPARRAGGEAVITRVEYASRDGHRTASIERVDKQHVPPIGVTWYLTRRLDDLIQPYIDTEYTALTHAQAAARTWIGDKA